ncbi:MAG: hypothetical protein KIG88_06970 [Weeksellaceae bacterium]|nr:hypothetical protein [Weeksellaceae bacterium]
MIRFFSILILSIFITSCTTNSVSNNNATTGNKLTFEPNDNGEYDIIVFDPQYDIFLKSIARPKTYNTYEFYKSKNRMYTSIWNQRHMMPSVYNPNLYAVSIDLDSNVDYGLDFEYKLFNFFQFIEWKYKVRLM